MGAVKTVTCGTNSDGTLGLCIKTVVGYVKKRAAMAGMQIFPIFNDLRMYLLYSTNFHVFDNAVR